VHARIIWCCSWTHDSKHFFTGSRDGKVAVWGHSGAASETTSPLGHYNLSSKPLELQNQSVTALAVAPVNITPDVYLVAVGLENGCINFYKWSSVSRETAENWQACLQLDNSYPFFNNLMIIIKQVHVQVKLFLLHATDLHGERRYSSCSFFTMALNGVSGQCHAVAVLYACGKNNLHFTATSDFTP
jgi:WD40 repeat protein